MGEAKRPPMPKICHTYRTMMRLGTVIPYLIPTFVEVTGGKLVGMGGGGLGVGPLS